ncbi:hypothetical protein [Prevotella sp.]|uniref:hypothetical protein n=1 Tax=Prevotella sp. TaxID=59823 RepID=UPI003DA5E52D
MMQNNLFLRRLVILTEQDNVAYDEKFHRGVNIIRGQNSSGKSTIIRFIFYILGGCYGDFVPEALRCKLVMAEVEINGQILMLKRYLEKTEDGSKVNRKTPLYIYYGSMAECKNDRKPEKWQKYGYNTTADRRSFSNVLFEIMGLPEFKADSNITMHQILRLIYLDQESPLSSLFFFEIFDKEIIRETVAELLMGLYNENLSSDKLTQIEINKRIDEIKQSIKISLEFLSDPTQQSPTIIKRFISSLSDEIQRITEEVSSLRKSDMTNHKVQSLEYQRLRLEVTKLRSNYVGIDDKIELLKADIEDSNYFIKTLEKKISALDRSIATRTYFDKLHLAYCPECLSKIDEDNVEEGHCRLCKSPIDNSKGKSQAIRIKLELEFQIRESQSLLNNNNKVLQELKTQRKGYKDQLNVAQKQYDTAISHVRSTREEQIDKLIQDKGYKEGEIRQYQTMLEQAEKYEKLVNELKELKTKKDKLDSRIKNAELKIKQKRIQIENVITMNGVYLLKNDQDRQAEFRNATSFKMDFGQNVAYMTDRHVKLSASSSFYLKMTARFALFLASVETETMMYPRLIFSDNMEDKGLEENRSRNFQSTLIKRLADIGNPNYQVIFATSSIAKELDNPEYTIGEYYTEENKSLKIKC